MDYAPTWLPVNGRCIHFGIRGAWRVVRALMWAWY